MSDKLTVHLDEIRPGLGNLDYKVLLKELSGLDPDLPVMLEHLSGQEEYAKAAEHIRGVAKEVGVTL
jgi:sugar phosphate isomerase/epimerase